MRKMSLSFVVVEFPSRIFTFLQPRVYRQYVKRVSLKGIFFFFFLITIQENKSFVTLTCNLLSIKSLLQ